MNPSYILKILFFVNPNQLGVSMIDDTNGNQKKPLPWLWVKTNAKHVLGTCR